MLERERVDAVALLARLLGEGWRRYVLVGVGADAG